MKSILYMAIGLIILCLMNVANAQNNTTVQDNLTLPDLGGGEINATGNETASETDEEQQSFWNQLGSGIIFLIVLLVLVVGYLYMKKKKKLNNPDIVEDTKPEEPKEKMPGPTTNEEKDKDDEPIE